MTKKQKERNLLLVEALRSGEFKQTRNLLKTEENGIARHCCLGVACEIYKRHTSKGRWTNDNGSLSFRTGNIDSYTTPPPAVANWYGWGGTNPHIPVSLTAKQQNYFGLFSNANANVVFAAEANDHGVTFKKIATAFEKLASTDSTPGSHSF